MITYEWPFNAFKQHTKDLKAQQDQSALLKKIFSKHSSSFYITSEIFTSFNHCQILKNTNFSLLQCSYRMNG